MVPNLFRLSNDLGLIRPMLTFDFLSDSSEHKNPIERPDGIVSEQCRLLVSFGIKKSGSRPETLNIGCRDITLMIEEVSLNT